MQSQDSITIEFLFTEDYKRILNGEHLNMVNRPYTKRYILKMKHHYEELEQYEKCTHIIKYMEARFSHINGWNRPQIKETRT